MSPISAVKSALSGIRQNQTKMNDAANRIASGEADSNLVSDALELKKSRQAISVNVAVLKTANDLYKNAVDILA